MVRPGAVYYSCDIVRYGFSCFMPPFGVSQLVSMLYLSDFTMVLVSCHIGIIIIICLRFCVLQCFKHSEESAVDRAVCDRLWEQDNR